MSLINNWRSFIRASAAVSLIGTGAVSTIVCRTMVYCNPAESVAKAVKAGERGLSTCTGNFVLHWRTSVLPSPIALLSLMYVFLAAITSWLIRPVNSVLSYTETNEGDIPGAVCLRPYTAPCLGKCLLKDAITLLPPGGALVPECLL